MKINLEKNDVLSIAAVILAIMLFIAAGFYFFLGPKKEELASMEDQLKAEEQVLHTLEMKLAETDAVSSDSAGALLQKVPAEKQLENLVLDLNKAELMSESFIVNMAFAEGEAALAELEDPEEETVVDQEEGSLEDGGQEATPVENSGQEAETAVEPEIPLPEGLQQLTATVEVTSPGYDEMMMFIETLESQGRLVEVDAIEFDGQFEQTTVTEEAGGISYKLILSAFYMPGLEDLEEEMPQLSVPPSSNKKNPFASFSEIPEEAMGN